MRGEKDRNYLKKSFYETEKLFLLHFSESPVSTGISDCGALCNEPTPKVGYGTPFPNERPTLTWAGRATG